MVLLLSKISIHSMMLILSLRSCLLGALRKYASRLCAFLKRCNMKFHKIKIIHHNDIEYLYYVSADRLVVFNAARVSYNSQYYRLMELADYVINCKTGGLMKCRDLLDYELIVDHIIRDIKQGDA